VSSADALTDAQASAAALSDWSLTGEQRTQAVETTKQHLHQAEADR
jgi:hypothetical protein